MKQTSKERARDGLNLREVNRRLRLVGWNDFELDDHTLQLVIASLEAFTINPFKPKVRYVHT